MKNDSIPTFRASLDSNPDLHWMRHALGLAERGWGTTHPNPMVGCVIVKDGQLISEGWHERAGEAHAERMALENAHPDAVRGATLYVTLEPCSTHGRTGACVDRILKSGVSRVVIATLDPNPAHRGRAVPILREAGIEVVAGCCEEEARRLNWIFNHHIAYSEPFVAGETAVTLDGKIATRDGHSQWITNEVARMDVMRWRALFPVIAVGAGTALADNPALTIRREGQAERAPTRMVFDRSSVLEPVIRSLRLFTDEFCRKTVWIKGGGTGESIGLREADWGGEIWTLPAVRQTDQVWVWQEVLRLAYQRGWVGIWAEGGRMLLSSLLSARKLHALWCYRAPLFLADSQAPGWIEGAAPHTLQQGFYLNEVQGEQIGTNQLMRGLVCYPNE